MTLLRRDLLMGAVATGVAALVPTAPIASMVQGGVLTTARNKLTGRYLLVRLNGSHEIDWEVELPGRGHEVLVRPGSDEGVVIARRPGVFAFSFDLATGETRKLIQEPFRRHLYGHGVFSQDGKVLWLTENLYEKGVGVIGMYDATDGYRRIWEFPSQGVGPHQIDLMADGTTLVVANGGIRTHPSSGREKLNLSSMKSSLVYMDGLTGALLGSVGFEGPRQQKLSLRHLAVLSDGRVAIACQDEGPKPHNLPLVYLHDPATPGVLSPLPIPQDALDAMQGYCGAIAANWTSDALAVTAPRGGLINVWSLPDGGWSAAVPFADVCGIDAASEQKGFYVMSGLGASADLDVNAAQLTETSHLFPQWDNHAVSLTATRSS